MAQETNRQDLIRYDLMVQDALRSVVRRVLTDAAKFGLPGEHYFYVTFKTRQPGVKLSARMLQKYPEEMNIILQHQFWDLSVAEEHFEVGLSFGGVAEKLLVPFASICGFYDPSVEFGLKFEVQGDAANDSDVATQVPGNTATQDSARGVTRLPVAKTAKREPPAAVATALGRAKPALVRSEETAAGVEKKPVTDKAAATGNDTTKVVSIDAFRKKP